MKGKNKTGTTSRARLKKEPVKKSRLKKTPGRTSPLSSKNKKTVKENKELFPVVAIGASAGGIEAISKLLENLSSDLGMAYIIIQHPAPNHESILPELLERKTEMPVHQGKQNMHILPDNIYVIPPNTYMSITDSKLKLSPRVKKDGSDYLIESPGKVYKNKATVINPDGSASRKKAEWLLKENEERFRLLVQNASDIISILSPEGNITYESESVERILGYKPEERLGKNIFKDLIVHPEDMQLKISAFQKSISNANETVKTGFRLRHKNGGYRDIEAVYLNLLDNPCISGIVANYHDVTDQRKIENQREEFVSIASHELRTPVTSLKGYIQIIKDMLSASGDTFGSEILQKLNHQVDRLISLIKDLFDVTKIREGQLDLNTTHFNINKLIDEVMGEMQLGAKKHLLVADLKAKKRVTADSERIGQVLRNLISNALKFSPGADKIIITSASDEEKITVCVQDFGIGIDHEQQKKIFNRFFRIKDDRLKNNAGLGLGLYISSEIIKHHKGTITVTSEKGKGSTFCFTIPVKYSG